MPISGDLRLGGTYQLEGNAGGRILACDRPNRLQVTWAYGDPTAEPSILELRLAPAGGDTTRFELEHTAVVPDEFWTEYGPGAVGVGWDIEGARPRAPPPWWERRRSAGVAAVGRGSRDLAPQQRCLGRREPGRRRGPRRGRARRREHVRVLRAGPDPKACRHGLYPQRAAGFIARRMKQLLQR